MSMPVLFVFTLALSGFTSFAEVSTGASRMAPDRQNNVPPPGQVTGVSAVPATMTAKTSANPDGQSATGTEARAAAIPRLAGDERVIGLSLPFGEPLLLLLGGLILLTTASGLRHRLTRKLRAGGRDRASFSS
jgi:hypothetical protein